MPSNPKRVRIERPMAERLSITDRDGNPITNPTVAQFREAVVDLATASGSRVIKMTVDGVFVAVLMAGEDEVPDGEAAMNYANHLIELAETFLQSAKDARAELISCSSKGGNA
jgi:hypothetical protein